MTLYMKTTVDEYELPVAIADSPGELARMLGTNANVVSSSISHKRPGWHRIEIGLEEYHATNDGMLWAYLPNGKVVYFD